MADNPNSHQPPAADARLFIAIEIPDDLRGLLGNLQDRLQTGCRFVDAHPRWVSPDNFHLTLAFLGSTPRHKIPEIRDAMEKATARFQDFEIKIGKVGLFPPDSKVPKVISVDISSQAKSLHRLNGALMDCLHRIGFQGEHRAFHPHLTLARLPSAKTASRLESLVRSHAGMAHAKFPAKGIVLFESRLGKDGPTYLLLHTAILSARTSI